MECSPFTKGAKYLLLSRILSNIVVYIFYELISWSQEFRFDRDIENLSSNLFRYIA